MLSTILKTAVCGAILASGAVGVARADCESDLLQMEQAYKSPALTPAGKAALDANKPIAVSALKKDDDDGCHKAVADALGRAGIPMK